MQGLPGTPAACASYSSLNGWSQGRMWIGGYWAPIAHPLPAALLTVLSLVSMTISCSLIACLRFPYSHPSHLCVCCSLPSLGPYTARSVTPTWWILAPHTDPCPMRCLLIHVAVFGQLPLTSQAALPIMASRPSSSPCLGLLPLSHLPLVPAN